jgi:hypothetical protein
MNGVDFVLSKDPKSCCGYLSKGSAKVTDVTGSYVCSGPR